ncbi:RluA family pseudouridine synthase [Dialister pneumosintes]|uniref:Pseudouridine synthase n=1 Tax=Dialister pneumosintes TaxID=39950 RepID=A0ABX9MB41_9FIRM|nr:RluA family pseudouridine synthase [Dialister pneumosintes]RID94794.1 RluA family pseudouridine synthase [Dialister pneumosintes]
MKEYTVGKKDANLRVDRFLMNKMPEHSKLFILKSIKNKKIRVNQKHPKKDDRLVVGDRVVSYILEKADKSVSITNIKKKFSVVYEDKNILIVNKESGILSGDTTGKNNTTLEEQVNEYLKVKAERATLCHRIDFNTSGLVILAKNRKSLEILNEMFKEREVNKYYLYIAVGNFNQRQGILKHYLTKDAVQSKVWVSVSPKIGAKKAIMEYRVLLEAKKLSLVECRLETGRTHQIRCQMAYIGHPLLGDNKYGKKAINKEYGESQQLLCAYKISFNRTDKLKELGYLAGKTFKLPDVAFVKQYFNQ